MISKRHWRHNPFDIDSKPRKSSEELLLARVQEIEEKKEKERLEKERIEKERLEKERLEKERIEKERLEKERIEKERIEKERLEKERLEKERLENERLEKERLEKEREERLERERLETLERKKKMEQLDLSHFRKGVLEYRKNALDVKFEEYHRDNPRVWELFVAFTFQLIEAGRRHYSADAVMHRIRWHAAMETTGDEFKINNNHVSRYARMFHKTYPEHVGFFRTRVLRGER